MNIDHKIELIRLSLEKKYGGCKVNRHMHIAVFFFYVDGSEYEIPISHYFIEAMELIKPSANISIPDGIPISTITYRDQVIFNNVQVFANTEDFKQEVKPKEKIKKIP